MKHIEIKNELFFNPKPGNPDSKFEDDSALGFSWRPGQEQYSLKIKDCEINGQGVSEGLKLSFCRNVEVEKCTILGGYEDCVDIVRGENISFKKCTFISQNTKQHITAKGGIKNLSFIDCTFVNSFSKFYDGACIDLGNWTDYDDVDRPMVRDILIENCEIKDVGLRVLYRRLYAENPIVRNCQGFGLKVPRLFVKLFWAAQRKGWLGKRRSFPESWLKIYDFEK
jgi:hypothetical protein